MGRPARSGQRRQAPVRTGAVRPMAGATVVGVGSAVYYRGVAAFREIGQELVAFMERYGYASIEAIRGLSRR